MSVKNDEILYLQFSNKQISKPRVVPKKDKNGHYIKLVSLYLPQTSKYYGYYFTVDSRFVNPSPFSSKMSSYSIMKNAMLTIHKWDSETRHKSDIKITAEELKQEFDSWRTSAQSDTSLVSV